MKRRISMLIAVLLLITTPALARNGNAALAALPNASDYSASVLPDIAGVVSWKTLAQVVPVKQGVKIAPSFSKSVLDLDRQNVRVHGFMMPLEMGNKQRHFLVSAVPPSCPFCMPAGPEAIVEVLAKKPVAYGFQPVIVSGRFALLKESGNGMLYRLTDAEVVAAPTR